MENEKINKKFKEKREAKCRIYAIIAISVIIIAFIWIISLLIIKDTYYDYILLIINMIFFFLLFTGAGLIILNIYNNESRMEERSDDFNRKISWEVFQKELNEEENEARSDFEKEKYKYEQILNIAKELNIRNTSSDEKIKEMAEEIERLKNKKEAHFIVELKKDKPENQ